MNNLFKSRITDNLEDLRDQLAEYLTLIMIVSSGLSLWLTTAIEPYPVIEATILVGIFVASFLTFSFRDRNPRLSRYLLSLFLVGGLLAGMFFLKVVWLPNLGLLLIFVCAILVSGGAFLSAGSIALASVWMVYSGVRAYDLGPLIFMLLGGLIVSWLVTNTLYTSLEWTRTMNQRANELLEEARQQRAELSVALKSLNQAYDLQKRTQNELVWARKRAEDARRSKEQFAANISHELRTPLNLILGFTEMMYVSPQIYGLVNWTPPLRQDIYQIFRNSRHLLGLIDDILDLSRFEITGFTLNLETIAIGPLIIEAAEIARDLFRGRSIDFQIEIQEDLPALEVDQTRIRQVLLNLLNNASRFTQQGVVRLSGKVEDHRLLIQVNDTGPGIPQENLGKIFDEFYQVDSSIRREHGGAGLGLAICRQFVEAHNGSIWVESVEGVGSTFSFTIPLKPGLQYEGTELGTDISIGKQSGIRPLLLIVDPDPSLVTLVKHLLQNFDLVQVENTDLLSEAIFLHKPHAIILNNPSGENILDSKKLAAIPVPILECALPTRLWCAQQLQIAAFLTKPIIPQDLIYEVKRLGNLKRVLLVDDDRGFLQFIERILQSADRDLELTRAYDNQEALDTIVELHPDLILFNLSVADDDGPASLNKIRDLAHCPVILFSDSLYTNGKSLDDTRKVSIWQQGGFQPMEILQIVNVLMQTLKPRYGME